MNKMEIIMQTRFLDLTRAIDEYIACGNKDVFTYNADKNSVIDNQLKRICSTILGVKKVTIYADGINSWRADAIYENQEDVTVERKIGSLDKEKFSIITKGFNHSDQNYTDALTNEEIKKVDELLTMLPLDRTRTLKRFKDEYDREKDIEKDIE